MPDFSRRQFLKLGLCVAAAGALPRVAFAETPARVLSFYNLHTSESLRIAYHEFGAYVPSAMDALNHFLRDYRTGDAHPIDQALFDQLYALQHQMETTAPFHVISGYRAPQTNQMLHANSDGVARRSLHMDGRAIDIRLPGRDLANLHKAALAMQAGGVGYYPSSDFIHLDTGRVRQWG
ncbi:MAG: DUF882 domain-containing protein [Rickettsiales bacterium]